VASLAKTPAIGLRPPRQNALMLKASDIIEIGYYWYFAGNGADPVKVEVRPAEAPEPQLEVRFPDCADWLLLSELAGKFEGPLPPRA
jgi:hypothetical protein